MEQIVVMLCRWHLVYRPVFFCLAGQQVYWGEACDAAAERKMLQQFAAALISLCCLPECNAVVPYTLSTHPCSLIVLQ